MYTGRPTIKFQVLISEVSLYLLEPHPYNVSHSLLKATNHSSPKKAGLDFYAKWVQDAFWLLIPGLIICALG